MVQLYVYLIHNGVRTLEQVPLFLRDEVEKALEDEKKDK